VPRPAGGRLATFTDHTASGLGASGFTGLRLFKSHWRQVPIMMMTRDSVAATETLGLTLRRSSRLLVNSVTPGPRRPAPGGRGGFQVQMIKFNRLVGSRGFNLKLKVTPTDSGRIASHAGCHESKTSGNLPRNGARARISRSESFKFPASQQLESLFHRDIMMMIRTCT
jgi:hypothetical protein